MNEKLKEVRDLISEELDISLDCISMRSRLHEDLKLDSLDLVRLTLKVEEELLDGVEIPNEDLESVKTVSDLMAMVERMRRRATEAKMRDQAPQQESVETEKLLKELLSLVSKEEIDFWKSRCAPISGDWKDRALYRMCWSYQNGTLPRR